MTISANFWSNNHQTPDRTFDALCKLTLKATALPALTVCDKPNTTNRWLSLLNTWNEVLNGGATMIFLDAIHRCMWGFPHPLCDPNYSEIVAIVQYELLRDSEAYNAWDESNELKEALNIPVNGEVPWLVDAPIYQCSVPHYEFLATTMLYKIQYSKHKYRKECTQCVQAMEEYPTALSQIIPDFRLWSVERMYDERNIISEINRLYGIDYSLYKDSYANLLDLLMAEHFPLTPQIAYYASQIEFLPYPLVKTIWPKFTLEVIEGIFLLAYWGATGTCIALPGEEDNFDLEFALPILRKSWMYKYFEQVSPNELAKPTKTAFFDITMKT